MRTQRYSVICAVVFVSGIGYTRSASAVCLSLIVAFLALLSTPPDPRLHVVEITSTNSTALITYGSNETCQQCTYACDFEILCNETLSQDSIPIPGSSARVLFPPSLYGGICTKVDCSEMENCTPDSPCFPEEFACAPNSPVCCLSHLRQCIRECITGCRKYAENCLLRCGIQTLKCFIWE